MPDPLSILNLQDFSKRNDVVQVIVDSVVRTITNFSKLPVKAGTPVLGALALPKDLEAASVIRYEGPALSLEIFLGLSKDITNLISDPMLQGFVSDASVSADLAGEILNIAFGHIDPSLSALSIKMKSSFPQKFHGPTLVKIRSQLPQQGMNVPILLGDKKIHMDIFVPGGTKLNWQYTPVKR